MGDVFTFSTAYSVENDPAFPGTGEWECPVFNLDRDGSLVAVPESRWGTPVVIRITPHGGPSWVGMFAAGGLGGVREVRVPLTAQGRGALRRSRLCRGCRTPRSRRNDREQPSPTGRSAGSPAAAAVRSVQRDRCLGAEGMAWSSRRLCVDDLRIVRAASDAIECTCDNFGGAPTITVDPRTGEQVAGTTMRDLGWPGE